MNIEDIFDLSNQKDLSIKMPEMVAGFEPKISSAPLITPEKAKSILTGITEFGASLGPGGGIADAAGFAANPFGEGKLPSFGENVLDTIAQFQQGNYVSGASKGLESALQALGTAGDTVQMAGIASGVGAIPALAIGAGMKLPLKAKRFLTGLDSIKTIPAKGEYTTDFTNLVKSFQEERPDIYNAATKMMNNNKLPEESIVKMINSRLNTSAKVTKAPTQQNLNFISDTSDSYNQKLLGKDYLRSNYEGSFERPIHFNSTIVAQDILSKNPDGLTGKEIYNYLEDEGFSPDNYRVVKDALSSIEYESFKLNDFKRAWSFIYDNIAKGVGFHADPSSVNVNIWVTPEKSLLDKTKNGLLIVNKKPPDDWIREQWNGNKDGCIDKLLQKEKHEVTRIDYKCNRAVFFDGALFHATDDVSTKYGDYNRRVSYTMLFGNPVK